MVVASISEFKEGIQSYIRDVVNNCDTLIIKDDDKAVVMISLEEYNSWQETSYLLSTPANAQDLRESIGELNAGKGVLRTIDEIEIPGNNKSS